MKNTNKILWFAPFILLSKVFSKATNIFIMVVSTKKDSGAYDTQRANDAERDPTEFYSRAACFDYFACPVSGRGRHADQHSF
ncbi:MAG: hypothetical protein IJX64_06630 [Clostridia bacterium]|nr:hypothetical protein [Clostridia bacterium]